MAKTHAGFTKAEAYGIFVGGVLYDHPELRSYNRQACRDALSLALAESKTTPEGCVSRVVGAEVLRELDTQYHVPQYNRLLLLMRRELEAREARARRIAAGESVLLFGAEVPNG